MARRTRRNRTRKNKRGVVNKRTRKNKRNKKKKQKKTPKSNELNLQKLINMSHKARKSHKTRESLKKKQLSMRAPVSPLSMNKNKIKQHLLNNDFDKNEKVFVLIHANWCGYCKEALPKFMEAQKIIKNDSNCNVNIEEYECDEYPELKNIASGYPTFLEIVNNKINPYEGPREVDDIVSECRNL